MNKEKQKNKMKKKLISLFEITTLMFSMFAFMYFISFAFLISVPLASAVTYTPTGCCIEGNDGAICQDFSFLEQDMCKTNLLSTNCASVENCQKGCCYSASEGICSLNAPKSQCIANGGNWSNSPNCDIPQCVMGCCILGEEASVATPRECTKLSRALEFETNFQPMDSSGACQAYTGASDKGACLTPTNDYSGEFNCKFTNKGNCKSGDFRPGFLCTAPELNTICKPSKKTTCVEGKDQVYYLDSCNNLANVYDSTKLEDEAYWTVIIDPASSCSSPGKDCGNCDYISGSVCEKYRDGKDAKPTYGDNVCRDLNCANGKKHGETWCISDYTNTETGVAPVGSRWFKGICMDGEITIEPCADFNNEICIEASSNSRTEAQCIMNDWRSCISANDEETYEQVEDECEDYEQCIMFLDIPGNEQYVGLPGFMRTNTITSDFTDPRGRVGTIGANANTILPHCVPKNTPGMVFWETQDSSQALQNMLSGGNSSRSSSSGSSSSNAPIASAGNQYGGTLAETQAICSLGSFTCVSHKVTDNPNGNTQKTDRGNWQCNLQSEHSESEETVPLMLEALNERCRSLGPCGLYVNIAGEMGSNEFDNSTLSRTYINPNGDQTTNYNTAGYILEEDYLGSLAGKAGIITAGSLRDLTIALFTVLITGKASATDTATRTTASNAAASSVGAAATESESTNAGIQTGAQLVTTVAALPKVGSVLGVGGASATVAAGTTSITAGMVSTTPMVFGASSASTITVGGTTFSTANGAVFIGQEGGTLIATQAQGLGTVTAYAAPGEVATVAPAASAPGASGASAGSLLLGAAIGAIAGYLIGDMIAENSGMTPGETESFVGAMTGVGAAVGTAAVAVYSASTATVAGTTTTVGLSGISWAGFSAALGPVGWVILIASILYSIYSYFFTGEDHEYWIMQYSCEPWEPPTQGDCSLCNNDVRTCSEYRCRSLGMNCQYYIENGEPGYCASLDETWSATITPWQEALTEGLSYSEVRETSFRIINPSNSGLIEKQVGFSFGIITDKYAQCRIDNKHTKTFDEMAVQMETSIPAYSAQEAQNPSQGSYHRVTLSPHMGNKSSSTTLGFVEGENNFYIRCKNFAGMYNRGEFAVKINVDNGVDLTPPAITSFNPTSGSYLKVGANSSSVVMWVNEPSDCKYSKENKLFNQMNSSLYCMTNPESARLGEWPCYALLDNLNAGDNKFYFKCKDQPNLDLNNTAKRPNVNENPKEYNIKVCKEGLNITSITPENQIVTGQAPISAKLEVKTSGCIESGKSKCSYKFENTEYIQFFSTNAKTHSQTFTSMPAGNNKLTIKCIDDAGNFDEKEAWINVTIDNLEPIITRAYDLSRNLVVLTNENSICYVNKNVSSKCDFNLNPESIISQNLTLMEGIEKTHRISWEDNSLYFVKCRDVFGNENSQCAMAIKTYI